MQHFLRESLYRLCVDPPHARPLRTPGIYYDGILFPRETLLRIRRVLSRNKGDQSLIDLHDSNTGQGGPALTYMMFFPYVDRYVLNL